MGWLIALLLALLLSVAPLGIQVHYDQSGTVVKVIAGPLKITLAPRPKKEKKEKKKELKKKEIPPEEENLPKPPQLPAASKKKAPAQKQGGSIMDFLPLVQVGLDFLNDFRRKLQLDNLYLRLILAGDDPCDLAVNYGRTWAAEGNLLPQLERFFIIKNRDIEVECDFEASETLITAHLDATIPLGQLLDALGRAAVRALKEYLKLKKKRKGGAVT